MYSYRKSSKVAYLYVLPAVVLILFFIVVPILQNIFYSLYQWSSFSPDMKFLGFGNYTTLFKDADFYQSLLNNVSFAIISVLIQVFFSAVMASVLEEKFFVKMQPFFRTAFFIPSVIAGAVTGLMFQLIYDNNIGLINSFLKGIGLGSLANDWLGNTHLAIYSVIAVPQWQSFGYTMMIILISMHTISGDIYEAAMLDGVNWWQKFSKIIMPNIKQMIMILTLITVIGSFNVFDIVNVMTQGGPGRCTDVLSMMLYRSGFRNDQMGYATAIATIIFIVTVSISLIEIKVSNRSEK